MEQLESAYRAAGITVPFTHNEKGQRSQSWSTGYEDVGGPVNIYGPIPILAAFHVPTSILASMWSATITGGLQTIPSRNLTISPSLKVAILRLGGGFYDDCLAEHDPSYADIYYKNNIGQRTTIRNLYMAWGGTNWVRILMLSAP
jgi:hypothetical protein